MMTTHDNTLDSVRQRLRGPVAPIKLPFMSDGSIDLDNLQSYVDWLCDEGAPILLLTYGTTEYVCLEEEELDEITHVIGQVIGGRSLFIASSDFWPVDRTLAYIDRARESGADAVKVQLNWRFVYGDSGIVDYYRQVVERVGDYPLLAYTDGRPGISLEALKDLAQVPSIIGMKNDSDPGEDGYIAYLKAVAPQLEIVSGGTMRNFLTGWPHGARTYLCAFAPIFPRISLEFYQTLEDGGVDAAQSFVDDYESPLFERQRASELGWQLYARGLHVAAKRFTHGRSRRPYADLTEEQIDRIGADLVSLGLIDGP